MALCYPLMAAKRLVASCYGISLALGALTAVVFVAGVREWAPRLGFLQHPAFLAWFVAATMAWCVFNLQDSVLTGVGRAYGPPLNYQGTHSYLYRNDGGNRNHWLSLRLVGTKSNHDGIGAVVRVQSPSGKQWSMVRSGSSYCSQSDLALTFGLGKDTTATVEIEWPSGTKQQLGNVAADQRATVDEARGLTRQP